MIQQTEPATSNRPLEWMGPIRPHPLFRAFASAQCASSLTCANCRCTAVGVVKFRMMLFCSGGRFGLVAKSTGQIERHRALQKYISPPISVMI